jgi:hypothetical protein
VEKRKVNNALVSTTRVLTHCIRVCLLLPPFKHLSHLAEKVKPKSVIFQIASQTLGSCPIGVTHKHQVYSSSAGSLELT